MRTVVVALALCTVLAGMASAQESLCVRRVGSPRLPVEAYDVALKGDLAYVADWNRGLYVISVHDPKNPVTTGHFSTRAVSGQ